MTNGLREVSINWQVALLLQKELEQDDVTIVMTKKREDEFVTNENRAAIANEKHADLFLRLHADAGNSTGFTVYYPRKVGLVGGARGPSPEILRRSATAAELFHQSFADALRDKLQDNGVRGDEETFIGGRQGALTGSIFSKVPTVLVEMVFLTNRTDAEWIKQVPNQVAMAKALAAGVRAVRDRDKNQ
jgi:N-acetylmuramoyl-L-alanine amidase